ncbi:ras-related protein Rab-5A isoform X2 [Drosophila pseudoobscura]|uniref:Ras-related protein Rab-5A isoform X2 n=1 Tax=Drosophila pseudoobscura pseudoobscura TaxID=46245 RepID=A0A6I8W0V8_DROPS|nr:ras-related protein Rab-5A isoform X2 [Drosophila pseudoobscura]
MLPTDYEVVILGDSNVGKTALISRYIKDETPERGQPTVGAEFLVKTICEPHLNTKLKIWDTAGQKCFKEILRRYYTDYQGALLVYDIHNRQSYESAKKWAVELKTKRCTPRIVIALVGHKADITDGRAVGTIEAEEYAKENSLFFWETSSVTNLNIRECFLDVVLAMKKAEICCCFEGINRSSWYL